MMNGKPLRVLIVENSTEAVERLLRELRNGGYDPVYERVETASAMKIMLEKHAWDIVLANYSLSSFSGVGALTELQLSGLDLPFIIVSDTVSKDTATACTNAGAHDYIIKRNMKRLVPVIERELKEAKKRRRYKYAGEAWRNSRAL
ncbi:MAG: response regulator [wastewater metagenome]|nr:response regulator [Candidatus Loosdrechtia aerotolerans]